MDVIVEGWIRLAAADDAIDCRAIRNQAVQLFARVEHDGSASRLHERCEANELDEISVSLFGPEEDRLAAKILPVPRGPAEVLPPRKKRFLQPPEFVLLEPLVKISSRQQCERVVIVE